MATATMSPTAAATSSTSAPEIHSANIMSAGAVPPSLSLDGLLVTSPRGGSPETLLSSSSPSMADVSYSSTDSSADPDQQIIEALRSKDRIYVLKLGEQMEGLISERRVKIDIIPTTSYQRMLVHRCCTFYRLSPETDSATKHITVYCRSESRIPARRISELVPAEESTQPAFKIMRRSAQDGSKSRQNSQGGSVTGEDAELSDIDPSEEGSTGGRSSVTGSGTKRHLTLEERAAAYNEARSRIFMDFEEKEKEKEKDMSANSSTFSLGSASGGRGSSIGDLDDSASSAATESEWSCPVTRDKRDGRRGGSGTSSSRSMRSSGASFNNGSGSSRNSRATSPSFTYATISEPPATMDCQLHGAQPHSGYMAPYYYHYGTPGQMPPTYYPYYVPYGYPAPHPSDPNNPAPNDSMYYPPQAPPSQVPYMNPYAWPQSPPGQPMHPPQGQPQSSGAAGLPLSPHASQSSPPQPQTAPQSQYPAYMPPSQYNPYAMQGYHPPPQAYQPSPYHPPTSPMPAQPMYMPEMSHNGGGYSNGGGNGAESTNHSRASSRSSSHHGGPRRGAPRARGSWSYGPGAGQNGYTYNLGGIGGGLGNHDAVGPRFNSNVRRISGASSASGSTGARTPGDETSSTASSSTSSSRQTYTSTSSKHPLPPRPDWAVGLKAQPGLHPPRPHDHNNANSRTMSPARIGGQAHIQTQHQPQPLLQSNDFPPLSSTAVPERRQPAVGGAWTNPSSTRSILTPAPQGSSNQHGTALVHYPNMQQSTSQNPSPDRQADEQEYGFERPPPKGNAELFNPKGGGRSAGTVNGNAEQTGRFSQADSRDKTKQDKGRQKEEAPLSETLADKFGLVSLGERPAEIDDVPFVVQRPSSAVPPPKDGLDGAAEKTPP